jgi:hypothetical protein
MALRNTMLLYYKDQLVNSLYSENHTKPIIILRGQSFEILKQMIHTVTIALQRVINQKQRSNMNFVDLIPAVKIIKSYILKSS